MNWKLIFSLSLFGLAMAFATVYFISAKIEPFCWLIIFLLCAWLIARNAESKFFLHGFWVSLVNCVWITGIHIAMSATYLTNHPQEATQYAKMNDQMHLSVTQAMLIMGPVIGIISGMVLGVFALVAAKMFNK